MINETFRDIQSFSFADKVSLADCRRSNLAIEDYIQFIQN